LHRAEILFVGFKYAVRKLGSLIPVGILEIKIEEEISLLAAFLKIGSCSRSCAALARLPCEEYDRAFTMTAARLLGSSFSALSESFSLSPWSPRASARCEADT